MDSFLKEKELMKKSNEFKDIQNEIRLRYAIDVLYILLYYY